VNGPSRPAHDPEGEAAPFACCFSDVHTTSTESGQLSTALSTACRQSEPQGFRSGIRYQPTGRLVVRQQGRPVDPAAGRAWPAGYQREPPRFLPARPAPGQTPDLRLGASQVVLRCRLDPGRDWQDYRGCWDLQPGQARPPGNKPENAIAPFSVKTYYGFMTTWQTLKRAGYMHPDSSLEAALFSNRCGVVAV